MYHRVQFPQYPATEAAAERNAHSVHSESGSDPGTRTTPTAELEHEYA
jgi:hypothetical protein